MEQQSWRKTILDVILEQGGECSADSLHEGAEDEEDLEAALEAADQLVRDGLLVEAAGTYTAAPGKGEAVRAASRLEAEGDDPHAVGRYAAHQRNG